MEEQSVNAQHSHRVGTITLGGCLVLFGILFLLKTVFGIAGYGVLLKVWPIAFIMLGLEILLANVRQDRVKLIYDKTAMAVTAVLLVFVMCIAFLSEMISYGMTHMSF